MLPVSRILWRRTRSTTRPIRRRVTGPPCRLTRCWARRRFSRWLLRRRLGIGLRLGLRLFLQRRAVLIPGLLIVFGVLQTLLQRFVLLPPSSRGTRPSASTECHLHGRWRLQHATYQFARHSLGRTGHHRRAVSAETPRRAGLHVNRRHTRGQHFLTISTESIHAVDRIQTAVGAGLIRGISAQVQPTPHINQTRRQMKALTIDHLGPSGNLHVFPNGHNLAVRHQHRTRANDPVSLHRVQGHVANRQIGQRLGWRILDGRLLAR